MDKLPDDPQERLRILQERFYATLTGFFRGGTMDNTLLHFTEGICMNLKKVSESLPVLNEQLVRLNENIKQADESSGKLTSAIKNITFCGTVIALGSMLIAALNVGLEYWKYFHPAS